ncbi:MAG TPA: exodeoxyribonuclease VII small subunit [Levilinea sp.]|nr:exodeoxyribonuclease VII small subunit [Levilinea sp.]
MSENIAPGELSYEQAYAELEQIIALLEDDQAGLDGAIALFERGQALVQRCSALLDHAELRIRQLTAGGLGELDQEAS